MKSNSLYRGVQKRNGGKWGATIYDSKKRSQIWLGTFDTAEAAALAYDEAAVRFHGDRARLNFPERFLCEPLRPVITSNLQVTDPNLTLGVNGNNIPYLERFFLEFRLSLENIVFSPGEELGIGEGEVALEKQHDNPGEEFGIGEIGLDHMNVVHPEENIVDINEECIINSSQSPHRRGGIDISREELEEVSGMKRKDAAKSLDVSVSTFKRVCRDHHNQSFSTKSDQTDCLVTIKAKYGENFIKFQLSALSGVDVLTQEVSKRLKVDVADYIVKYQDDENDWILVACDDDLQGYISSSLSSGKTTLVMLIEHI